MLESLVDPIFRPLLQMPLFWSITLIALLMSIIITIAYRLMTDQSLMKDLKDELKSLQKEMKELKDNPQKMMKVQKKVMETNMKYMMHSMRPTLITFLPIIIIFGWLTANVAYEPLLPNQEFTTTAVFDKGSSGTVELMVPDGVTLVSDAEQKIINNEAVWTLKGKEGVYILEYVYNDNEHQTKELTISDNKYSDVVTKVKDKQSMFSTISLSNKKTKPLGDISLLGWKPGWLGVYIIMSIIFSMTFRKVFKIY